MKLYAESELCSHILNKIDAAALILFADAHSCALLKEAAFHVYKSDPMAVRKSDSWKELKKSPQLLDELFEYVAVEKLCGDETRKGVVENLNIWELRCIHLARDEIRDSLPDECSDDGYFPLH